MTYKRDYVNSAEEVQRIFNDIQERGVIIYLSPSTGGKYRDNGAAMSDEDVDIYLNELHDSDIIKQLIVDDTAVGIHHLLVIGRNYLYPQELKMPYPKSYWSMDQINQWRIANPGYRMPSCCPACHRTAARPDEPVFLNPLPCSNCRSAGYE